jgi:hypothetical protein
MTKKQILDRLRAAVADFPVLTPGRDAYFELCEAEAEQRLANVVRAILTEEDRA